MLLAMGTRELVKLVLFVTAFIGCSAFGRGLHSSTSQLNLSRFSDKIHPKHPLILHTP